MKLTALFFLVHTATKGAAADRCPTSFFQFQECNITLKQTQPNEGVQTFQSETSECSVGNPHGLLLLQMPLWPLFWPLEHAPKLTKFGKQVRTHKTFHKMKKKEKICSTMPLETLKTLDLYFICHDLWPPINWKWWYESLSPLTFGQQMSDTHKHKHRAP